jgi:hypothetical protein
MTTALVLAAAATPAMAELRIATFTRGQPGNNYGLSDAGGRIQSLTNTYNTVTKQFSFTVNFSNQITDGFWLAVSPGPNPKGHSGELALIYFDATDTSELKASVYAYNGLNGDNSWQDGTARPGVQTPDFIGALVNGVNATMARTNVGSGRTLSLSFDASFIQNHLPLDPIDRARNEWTGVAFGQQYGIWFHPVAGLESETDSQGRLLEWEFDKQGYLDGFNFSTIPTPGAAAVLALGGLVAGRRRRAA